MNPRALIVGVTGQDGAYLARHLLALGYEVNGAARHVTGPALERLERLGVRERVRLHALSLPDAEGARALVERLRPTELYGLGGQTSVGASFLDPEGTHRSVGQGTLDLLEAVRLTGSATRVYTACSSEMFGERGAAPLNEEAPLQPLSPYGEAKVLALQHTRHLRRAYGLYACAGILFNHESPLRPEYFVTRKVVRAACRIAAGERTPLTLGDLSIRRDWGWAPEYVEAMHAMLQLAEPQDFVVATGRQHSLEDFVAQAFACVGLSWRAHVISDPALFRPREIRANVGDPSRAASILGWRARTGFSQLVERLVAAERGGEV